MSVPELPVLAITPADNLMHVATAAAVLAHVEAETAAGGGGALPVWEFFDHHGCTMSKQADPVSGTNSLVVDPGQPAPTALEKQLLVDRIDSLLARVQVRLTRDLVLGVNPQHIRVPRTQGDLSDVLVAVAAVMELPITVANPDPGSWIHNLAHRVFG